MRLGGPFESILSPRSDWSSLPGYFRSALNSCYTYWVPKNITIRISDEAALWARRKAAEENTSVSRFMSELLERQMRLTDEYWRAYERWKEIRGLAQAGAAARMTRDEAHERR